MKKWVLFVLVYGCTFLNPTFGKVELSIRCGRYYLEGKPYLEAYFHIVAASLFEKDSLQDNTKKVKITILFKKGNDIVKYDQFLLENDPNSINADIAMVKRYGLTPDDYNIVFKCVDQNNESNFFIDSNIIKIHSDPNIPCISDIFLYTNRTLSKNDEISRNGFFYEQVPFSFLDRSHNAISLYAEAYHVEQLEGQKAYFLVKIDKISNQKVEKSIMKNYLPKTKSSQLILDNTLDVSSISSGNYRLIIAICDANKVMLDSAAYLFSRSNPILDFKNDQIKLEDAVKNSFAGKLDATQLDFVLRSIIMNVNNQDVSILNELIGSKKDNAKMNYIFNYFSNIYPDHPESYFLQYLEVAKAVDKKYKSGLGYGFESDRGRIFMKYGKPNDMINITDDPVAPPYEIWVYYKSQKLKQSNVKFLFYNPKLDDADYQLLHSNARGELNNPNWKKKLYSAATSEFPAGVPNDEWEVGTNNNRRASQWFEDL